LEFSFTVGQQFTLVKLIKLKRTQTVCTEKERKRERVSKRERKREKTERKRSFFSFFLKEKLPPKKYKKIKKMPWHQGDRSGVSCHPGTGFSSKVGTST